MFKGERERERGRKSIECNTISKKLRILSILIPLVALLFFFLF
jgi:hypothetical protein